MIIFNFVTSLFEVLFLLEFNPVFISEMDDCLNLLNFMACQTHLSKAASKPTLSHLHYQAFCLGLLAIVLPCALAAFS